MTARLFDAKRELVCSCGRRAVLDGRLQEYEDFWAHASGIDHIVHVEHDGQPTDRKPRVR